MTTNTEAIDRITKSVAYRIEQIATARARLQVAIESHADGLIDDVDLDIIYDLTTQRADEHARMAYDAISGIGDPALRNRLTAAVNNEVRNVTHPTRTRRNHHG